MYCSYYQAQVKKDKTWFLVAILRSYEHCAFDRTLDKTSGIFEFFVPEGFEAPFLAIMEYFKKQEIISDLQKLDNRLKDSTQAF